MSPPPTHPRKNTRFRPGAGTRHAQSTGTHSSHNRHPPTHPRTRTRHPRSRHTRHARSNSRHTGIPCPQANNPRQNSLAGKDKHQMQNDSDRALSNPPRARAPPPPSLDTRLSMPGPNMPPREDKRMCRPHSRRGRRAADRQRSSLARQRQWQLARRSHGAKTHARRRCRICAEKIRQPGPSSRERQSESRCAQSRAQST